MVRKHPDGPWESEVLPYPPEQLDYGVNITVRFMPGSSDVYFGGPPCQGITADGTIFNLKLVDSMFIEGIGELSVAGINVVNIYGISYEDVAKLVRLVHTPEDSSPAT